MEELPNKGLNNAKIGGELVSYGLRCSRVFAIEETHGETNTKYHTEGG